MASIAEVLTPEFEELSAHIISQIAHMDPQGIYKLVKDHFQEKARIEEILLGV